jgi:hypothetical protein
MQLSRPVAAAVDAAARLAVQLAREAAAAAGTGPTQSTASVG